jgi:hypothetical protein
MKSNNETKNNRIIGLVIGLIFFAILFFFDFDDLDFDYKLNSIIGELSRTLAKSMVSGVMSKVSAAAKFFWWFFTVIYLILIWIYRGCIGFWFKRIISLIYKKI